MISTDIQSNTYSPALRDTYKAAVIAEPEKITFKELPLNPPVGHQVLVQLEGTGLCASNIPVWEGREWFTYPQQPGAPGHEGWGVVVAKGDEVCSLQLGQRVALLSAEAFAEYVTVDDHDCVPLPEQLHSMPFPGEPLGCLMNILDRADIQSDQTVAIIGLGFIGQGLVSLVRQKGARVIALSRRDSALTMAADEADVCIPMHDHWQIIERVNSLTGGRGCERVIECTGVQWPLDLASAIIGEYGKLIIAGYHQDGPRQVNMQQWNWKAIDVINAHERDPARYKAGIAAAIDKVADGTLKMKRLLTHRFNFSDLAKGMNALQECPENFVKAYVTYDELDQ
jgi:threonine dehydrogenase-like Zn-dependent dehydrogenase